MGVKRGTFSLHLVSEPDHCAETRKDGRVVCVGGLDDLKVCLKATSWYSDLGIFELTHGATTGLNHLA